MSTKAMLLPKASLSLVHLVEPADWVCQRTLSWGGAQY